MNMFRLDYNFVFTKKVLSSHWVGSNYFITLVNWLLLIFLNFSGQPLDSYLFKTCLSRQ